MCPPCMMLGTDILSLKRLKSVLQKYPHQLPNKILSIKEKGTYESIQNDRRRLEFLGGRFCGKEAIFKAAGLPNLTWKRVSILRQEGSRRPSVFIDEKLHERIIISISHEEEYATATAILME